MWRTSSSLLGLEEDLWPAVVVPFVFLFEGVLVFFWLLGIFFFTRAVFFFFFNWLVGWGGGVGVTDKKAAFSFVVLFFLFFLFSAFSSFFFGGGAGGGRVEVTDKKRPPLWVFLIIIYLFLGVCFPSFLFRLGRVCVCVCVCVRVEVTDKTGACLLCRPSFLCLGGGGGRGFYQRGVAYVEPFQLNWRGGGGKR